MVIVVVMASDGRKFPWTIYSIVVLLIFLFALAPVVSVVVAGCVANVYGCQVDEGLVHPCIFAGHDWGELLQTLLVAGWLMLLTVPAGAAAFVIWLIVLLFHLAKWKKKGRA